LKILLSIFFSLLLISPAGVFAAGDAGSVTLLKGKAWLKSGDEAEAGLSLGQALNQGDRVRTGTDGRVEMTMGTGQLVRLGPQTTVVIRRLEKTGGGVKGLLKALTGRVWFNFMAKKGGLDYRVEFPNAVVAIKGTVWRADVDEGEAADVRVYEGQVTARGEGEEEEDLAPGESLVSGRRWKKADFDAEDEEKDEWVRWNKNRDKLRVMVLLPEKGGAASVAETAVAAAFLKHYLYKVIDKEQVDRIRQTEQAKAALKGDPRAAAAAGLELGADIVVAGTATASFFKNESLGGLVSATANLNARAVRADTAEVLAAVPNAQARALDITDEAAAAKAMAKAGGVLAEEVTDGVLEKWRQERKKGSGLDLVVEGADFAGVKRLKQVLEGLRGVRGAQTLYLVGGRALLQVTYAGDSLGLAEALAKADFGKLNLEVVGLSAYRVEVETWREQ
jgi:hypothetical protein